MFKQSSLPHFAFVEKNDETRLDLSQAGRQIQGIADQVSLSFESNASVGLIFRSGPQLVLTWLAVVLSGRIPCILQYPTAKLSQDYWRQSICHTLAACNIDGVVHGPDLVSFKPESLTKSLLLDETAPCAPLRQDFPQSGAILQLSSGTTGQKKGIRFSFEQLKTHTERYNAVLQLTQHDTMVSWLPLYHDMGFIACFVMPLLLGVPVVMIDPMDWVQNPALLFESIQRHAATVCFMPNFGFEVLSHHPLKTPLVSMRQWISCSEPAYPQTMEKFQKAVGAEPATLSTCYGMAENVFAVSQSSGLELIQSKGQTFVSCGRPIPGTRIKITNDEIWVKSDHSILNYLGGESLLDTEGFYATGDLGFIHQGAVVITGRKVDLANIGGRKFLLNDLDVQMAHLFPDCAGRIASLRRYDKILGTEKVIFLVETERFWEKPETDYHPSVREITGLDLFELHFVPPFFITKTSSGKINRQKTLDDWMAVCQANRSPAVHNGATFEDELHRFFEFLPRQIPVKEVLDSLGGVMLRLLCDDHGIAFDPAASLEQMVRMDGPPPSRENEQIFSVVALTDGLKLGIGHPWGWADMPFLESLSQQVGCPVHFEHLIVPPAPILFSDLVFRDYFMPRMPGPEGRAVSKCLDKIKKASLIIVDDEDNFRLLDTSVYPRLDHRFIDAPPAAFLAYRFARYIQKHHLLPKDIVPGAAIALSSITPSLADLQAYLQKPVMRMAFIEDFKDYTSSWDYTDYRKYKEDSDFIRNPISRERLQQAIRAFVHAHNERLPRCTGKPENKLVSMDPQHFCSFLINPKAVLWVVKHYNSFCILGFPWNLPALEDALKKLGKPYCYATSWQTDFEPYDCIIMTGVDGLPSTSKPIFDFVHAAGRPGRPRNVPEALIRECPFFYAGVPEELKALSLKDMDRMPVGNFWLNRHLHNKDKRQSS